MIKAETLPTERRVSLGELSGLNSQVGLVKKADRRSGNWMQQVSKVFFKSADEMEADFWMENKKELMSNNQFRNNRDGYLNTNSERIDSGFMEENY